MIRYHEINSDIRIRRGYFRTSATFRKIPIGYNESHWPQYPSGVVVRYKEYMIGKHFWRTIGYYEYHDCYKIYSECKYYII